MTGSLLIRQGLCASGCAEWVKSKSPISSLWGGVYPSQCQYIFINLNCAPSKALLKLQSKLGSVCLHQLRRMAGQGGKAWQSKARGNLSIPCACGNFDAWQSKAASHGNARPKARQARTRQDNDNLVKPVCRRHIGSVNTKETHMSATRRFSKTRGKARPQAVGH